MLKVLCRTTILGGLEVFNANLPAMCQPLPPIGRKTTTLGANLHKGIKVCTHTSLRPTGEYPEGFGEDLEREFWRGNFGEDFGEAF